MRQRAFRFGRRHLIKGFFIYAQQANEGVAGQDVEIDIRQRLQIFRPLNGPHQRQKEAQPGDFHRLVHNVHAKQVVGDDLLADVVVLVGVAVQFGGKVLAQGGMVQEFRPPQGALVDGRQLLQCGYQERPRSAGGVEQAQFGQNLLQQDQGALPIHAAQQFVHVFIMQRRQHAEVVGVYLAHFFQHQPLNGLLAQIFGDLRPGVVCAKRFLVDVLFKNVAEDVRVDFAVIPAGAVIQMPGVAIQQRKQFRESLVGNGDMPPVLDFHRMAQKEAAIEIGNLPQHRFSLIRAFAFRQGKAFKKERVQKIEVIAVLPVALLQLVVQVIRRAVVNEALPLQKVDEHDAVEQRRGVPAAVFFVGDGRLQIGHEVVVDGLEFAVKLLGDPLDVQRRLHPLHHAGNFDAPLRVQFAHGHKQAANLAQVEIGVLPAVIMVGARVALAAVALHPIPDRVRPRLVHEDKQVFVVVGGDGFVYGRSRFAIGNFAIRRSHLKDHHARQFGNGLAGVGIVVHHCGYCSGKRRIVPAQLLGEQGLKFKCLQPFTRTRDVEFGHIACSEICQISEI